MSNNKFNFKKFGGVGNYEKHRLVKSYYNNTNTNSINKFIQFNNASSIDVDPFNVQKGALRFFGNDLFLYCDVSGVNQWNQITNVDISFNYLWTIANDGDEIIYQRGNVGIGDGMINPQYTLDVSGSIHGTSSLILDDSSGVEINGALRYNNRDLEFFDSSFGWVHIGSSVNPTSNWSKNGTNLYYTGGNVGIGTNNPSSELDVIGNSSSQNLILNNYTTSDTNSIVNIEFYKNGNDLNDLYGKIGFTQSGNSRFIIENNKGDISIGSNTTSNLLIDNTNNRVGIGITNPSSTLHVNGNIKTSEALILSNSNTVNMQKTGALRYNDSAKYVEVYDDGTWNEVGGGGTIGNYWTKDASDNITYNAGFVGIGTNLPNFPLEVLGTARVTDHPLLIGDSINSNFDLRFISALDSDMSLNTYKYITFGKENNTNNQGEIGFSCKSLGSENNEVSIGLFNRRSLVVTGNKNLGIGDITPDSNYTLDVNGKTQMRGDLDMCDNFINDVSGIYFSDGTFIGHGSSFDFNSNEVIKFNNTALVIGPSGNVGIGKIPDNSKTFDISGDFQINSSLILKQSNGIEINGALRYKDGDIELYNNGNWNHIGQSVISNSNWTKDTNNNLYYTGGSVGIGLTNPTNKLHVNGDFTANGKITSLNDAYFNSGIININNDLNGAYINFNSLTGFDQRSGIIGFFNNGSTNLSIANLENGLIIFETDSSQRMVIDYNGNVGIGTTNPTYKLDVENEVFFRRGVISQFQNYMSNEQEYNIITDTMQNGMYVYKISNNPICDLVFKVTNTSVEEALRISHTGNIGIGTTNPSAKLDISGDLITTQLSYGNSQLAGKITISGPSFGSWSETITFNSSINLNNYIIILSPNRKIPQDSYFYSYNNNVLIISGIIQASNPIESVYIMNFICIKSTSSPISTNPIALTQ